MSLNVSWWKSAVCLLAFSATLQSNVHAAEAKAPCTDSAHHQFDFWAGDWDVFEVSDQSKIAHASIDPILAGCVLREDYQQFDGHQGQSFTFYDASLKLWHQSWVTNRGEMLEIEGKLEGDAIVLTGEDHAAGKMVRGTWKPENGSVRETAVTSTDHGKTWQPWFDIIFRPAHGDDGDASGAKKTIQDLDTRYQAAVERNDAATMSQFLADDFMLVTGSGKSFSKEDLLEEARGGRFHYEQQSDTDKTVRIWGDTAVITAKLTAKGTYDGRAFDHQVWFSDTYVKTPSGWRYVFGQSSLPLSKDAH